MTRRQNAAVGRRVSGHSIVHSHHQVPVTGSRNRQLRSAESFIGKGRGKVSGLAVAAPHALAVRAASRVADGGGNVIEAAVAAAAALTVVYPHQCSLGGDLFAILRFPDGTVRSINSSGRYGTRPVAALDRMPVAGPLTVTVPGTVAGWEWLLDQGGGHVPLEQILQPAIELADAGAAVGAGLAHAMAGARRPPALDAGLRALLVRSDGTPLGVGDTLRQPRLAATLRDLADRGLRDFYEGLVGDRIAVAFDGLGIPVSRHDLADHEVVIESPLAVTAAGCRVMTSPPNSQGYLLLTSLLALDEYSRRRLSVDDRALVDLFAFGGRRRERELADPRSMTVDVEHLLMPDAISSDVDDLLAGLSRSRTPTSTPTVRASGDTVAVTAVAADGTAVSLIQSLFQSFGSRLRDPDTGIVFHNRGSFFSVDPTSPNALAPGKRPAHTLMPVLIEHPDGAVSAFGAMGGRAQPQIHAQLLRHVLGGAGPAEAVSAPRYLVGRFNGDTDSIVAESDLPPERLAALRRSGLEVRVTPPHDDKLGHAMICMLGPDGRLDAGADPRSDGEVLMRP